MKLFAKNLKKIIKHIIISWLLCQILVIYLHSWTEKLGLMVESQFLTSQRIPVSWLRFGYKKVNSGWNSWVLSKMKESTSKHFMILDATAVQKETIQIVTLALFCCSLILSFLLFLAAVVHKFLCDGINKVLPCLIKSTGRKRNI